MSGDTVVERRPAVMGPSSGQLGSRLRSAILGISLVHPYIDNILGSPRPLANVISFGQLVPGLIEYLVMSKTYEIL